MAVELHGLLFVLAVDPHAPHAERYGHIAARLTTDPAAPLERVLRSASVLDSEAEARKRLASRERAAEPLHWRFHHGRLPAKVDPSGWVEIPPAMVTAQRNAHPRITAVPWLVAMAALELCQDFAKRGAWPPPPTSEWMVDEAGILTL